MKTVLRSVVAVYMLCLASGCASFVTTENSTPKESQVVLPPVGNFNDRMKNLADQLDKNTVLRNPSNTYIVTSFTNLDRLGDTTALGRLISENLMHGLQIHKWQILEVRLTKGIDINADGEFSLSRDISKLKDEYKISGIVTGTYSVAEGNLTINARVINVDTGIVVSTGQTYIPAAWLLEAPSANDNSARPMKIMRDGIK